MYISSGEMEEYNRLFWGGGDVETPSHGFRSALNFEQDSCNKIGSSEGKPDRISESQSSI